MIKPNYFQSVAPARNLKGEIEPLTLERVVGGFNQIIKCLFERDVEGQREMEAMWIHIRNLEEKLLNSQEYKPLDYYDRTAIKSLEP